MNVKLNGKTENINVNNLKELIISKNLNPEHIVVEYNKKVIKKENWQNIQIQDNDQIEIITFVGGG